MAHEGEKTKLARWLVGIVLRRSCWGLQGYIPRGPSLGGVLFTQIVP
jgi:hypothetical protein